MSYNNKRYATVRPIAANRNTTYTPSNSYTAKTIEPCVKIPDNTPIIIRSKGMDFVVSEDEVCVFSLKHDKVIFSITDDKIIIGNPEGEHFKVKL
jgi:hypothetical protein